MPENYKILSQEFAAKQQSLGDFIMGVGYYGFSATSTDGINWNTLYTPNEVLRSVAYGNGTFVAAETGSNGTVVYSTDYGVNWSYATLPVSGSWTGVGFGNNVFIVVGTGPQDSILRSTDGVTWTQQTTNSSGVYWGDVVYGDNKFVILDYFNSSSIANYSTDGISWSSTPFANNYSWQYGLIYANGKFIATGVGSSFAYSTDGITWSNGSMPSSRIWYDIAYGADKFVCIAYDSDVAAYSTDGISWTEATLPFSKEWESITYANNAFIASGAGNGPNGLIGAYSTDGISWITVDTKTVIRDFAVEPGEVLDAERTLYTTPTNTQASISSIFVTNTGQSSGEYYLGVVKAEDSSIPGISDVQKIIPAKTLAAGEHDEVVAGITLSAGDQIRIYSVNPDITASIFGVEIS